MVENDPISLPALLLLQVVAMYILFVVFVRKKQNKLISEKEIMQQGFTQQLLQSQIRIQEETMSTLGKELHDNVGQLLSSTKMLIGVMERSLENPPEILTTADNTLSKAIFELRTLSKSLNREWIEQFNFIENLTAEVVRINSAKGIQVHLSHPKELPLKTGQQIVLFRIVQEVIQNAVKHANANTIVISIVQELSLLKVTITDDGRGFDMEQVEKGQGIINIRHRTELLSGNVEWTSGVEGTRVNVQCPLEIYQLAPNGLQA